MLIKVSIKGIDHYFNESSINFFQHLPAGPEVKEKVTMWITGSPYGQIIMEGDEAREFMLQIDMLKVGQLQTDSSSVDAPSRVPRRSGKSVA